MRLSGVGVVGPLKFSKIPLNDHGVHLKGLQTPIPLNVVLCDFCALTLRYVNFKCALTLRYGSVDYSWQVAGQLTISVGDMCILKGHYVWLHTIELLMETIERIESGTDKDQNYSLGSGHMCRNPCWADVL